MEKPTNDLYKGVRPSDMRFENIHLFAEYIAQAQRLVNTADATQQQSKELLEGALAVTRAAVEEFRASSAQLHKAGLQVATEVGSALDERRALFVGALRDAVGGLGHAAGGLIKQTGAAAAVHATRLSVQADRIREAASRLELVAAEAVQGQRSADDAAARLEVRRAEIQRYELACFQRIKAAEERLYKGVSLWTRVRFVFKPQRPALQLPRRP